MLKRYIHETEYLFFLLFLPAVTRLTVLRTNSLRPRQTTARASRLASLHKQQRLGRASAGNVHRRPHLARRHGAADRLATSRARRARDSRARRRRRRLQRRDARDDNVGRRPRRRRRRLLRPSGARCWRRAGQLAGSELHPAALIRTVSLAWRDECRCRDGIGAAAGVADCGREVAVAKGAFLAAFPLLDCSCCCWARVLRLGERDACQGEQGGLGELHGPLFVSWLFCFLLLGNLAGP